MNRVLKTILASARARLFGSRCPRAACAQSGDFVSLEPRVLYSASPIAEAIEEPVLDSGLAGSDAAGLFPDFSVAEESQGADGSWPGDPFTAEPLANSASELIVVDSRINDLDALLADLRSETPDANVLILQSEVDGIEQVSRVLRELDGLDSVHIVAHGGGGGIQLGSTWLTQENVAAYGGEIAGWQDSLASDADLLIYGCNLAESESGEELIDSLAELCACDVAASDDVTGHRSLGGDWDLEYQTGVVEDTDLFAGLATANWLGTLDITSNLVAHYEFEENGGSTALDSTANGNDGTLLNGPTWDSGSAVGDFAIDFAGDAANSNRVVTVADDASLDFNGDFTVSFWYNATASPVGSTRMIGSHDGSSGFSVFADGSNDVNFYIEGSSNFAIDTFTLGFEADGQWHHIAATKDSSGIQLYVDGVAGGVLAGTYGTINPVAPLTIGGESATISDFEGKLDDVRVYTRALSATDVGELRASAFMLSQSLWLTTDTDVTGSGVTGLGSWGASEILSFGDPGFSLEPGTTAGTVTSILNLDDFADDANADLNGMHYVSQAVVVGSGANLVTLLAGDVLLTVEANESFTSTNSISVTDDEIFAFRPDAVGDYSSGTFVLVADDLQSIHGAADTWALTLVETDTMVGDTTLTAGSFLVGVEKGGPGDAEDWIEWVTLTGAGAGVTSGASVILVDGVDIGNSEGIVGLELIESNVSIGGADLVSGQVLVVLEKNETVGTNSLAVTEHDVFVLDVTQTTSGSGTAQATASLLFEGADAGFDVAGERLAGITLVAGNQAPEVVASAGNAAFTESGPAVVVDSSLTVSDDSSSLESAVVQITGAFLAAEDSLNFVDQNGISGSYSSSTGILTLTGSASVANYQTALRSITYSNSSEDPDTTTRTVSFTVSDGSGSSTAATRNVTVSDVNDAPTLGSFAAVVDTTNEDTEVELTLAELLAQGDEADVDGTVDGFVVKSISSGTLRIGTSSGTATAWSAGSNDTITATDRAYWTPASNATGTQTAFEVVALDDDGAESSTNVAVTVSVSDVNDAPTLSSFAAVIDTANEDTEVELTLAELLAQGDEADVDGTVDGFVVKGISSGTLRIGTSSGTATAWLAGVNDTITATDRAYWTPASNATGTQTAFEIVALDDDGAESSSNVAVTVSVSDVNDAPTLSSFAAVIDTTNEDTEVELTLAELLAQGDEADVDGTVDGFVVKGISSGTLRIGTSSGTATAWSAGVNDTITAADRAYWTPASNATGTQTAFEVVALDDDGAESSSNVAVTVSVSDVNDAPTLGSFAAVVDTTNEDTEVELTLAELLAQGDEADVDGTVDGFVVKGISSGTLRIGTSSGTATAWSAGSNDTITATDRAYWTPASNATGTQTAFEVVALDDDGAESSTNVAVTVSVSDVNDAPVTADALGTFNEDTPGSIILSGSDPDGMVTSFVLNNLPANGGLYLDAGLTTSATTAFDYAATGGTLTVYFSPDADWSGVSGFGFAARDDDGLLDASAATATITVNAINDGPSVSTNVGLTLDEGSTSAIGNSLLNEGDVDDDGVELTYTLTRLASHGDILLSGTPLSLAGNFTQADIDLGRITYAHDGSEASADDFEFSLADGGENGSLAATGTFNIVVTPVNDAPVATADGFSVMEGSTHVSPGSILDNDTDAELDALTASIFIGPVNGTLSLNADGTFVYSHDGSETTADSFTYQVDDGNGGTAMGLVAITVNAVDDTPIATADAYSVFEGGIAAESAATGVLANDTDPDSTALVATLVSGPVNGTLTLNGDGSFSYSHDGSETLTDSFEYEVSDGNSTSRATVTLTVSAVNDAPVATGETFVVSEGGVVSAGASGLTANDTDAEGDVLTASLVSGPGNGTAVVNADGSFVYTHDGSESTSDTFVYRIDDGNGGMDTAIVSILVSGTNDAPIAGDDSYGLMEGGTLVSMVPGVLGNDSDAEGAPLSVSLVSGPVNGSLSLNSDGSFTYVHDDSETTSDAFVYMVSDGVGGTATATVSLAVTPVDDPPLAATDTFESTPGQPLSILPMEGVLGNDVDIDSASLTAVVVDTTSFGTLSLNPDGSFDYVPLAGFVGTDSFTYVVDDGNSLSNPVTVFINVQAVGGLDPVGSGGDSGEADDSVDDDMDEEGSETTTLPELSSPSGPGDPDRKLAARNRSGRSVSQSEGDEFVEPVSVPVAAPEVLTEFVSSDRLGLRVLSGIQIAVEYFDDELEFDVESYYHDVQLLWNNLNVIRDQIEEDSNAMAVAVGTATAVSGVATIGYLVWTLRGGYLVASLVSAVPAWRVFDPLPILEMHCQQRNDRDDASLQEMLKTADSEARLVATAGQSES